MAAFTLSSAASYCFCSISITACRKSRGGGVSDIRPPLPPLIDGDCIAVALGESWIACAVESVADAPEGRTIPPLGRPAGCPIDCAGALAGATIVTALELTPVSIGSFGDTVAEKNSLITPVTRATAA